MSMQNIAGIRKGFIILLVENTEERRKKEKETEAEGEVTSGLLDVSLGRSTKDRGQASCRTLFDANAGDIRSSRRLACPPNL